MNANAMNCPTCQEPAYVVPWEIHEPTGTRVRDEFRCIAHGHVRSRATQAARLCR